MAFDNGRVREWIGPRIVPVFADDVEWDDSNTYEPLIMVQHEGETFMSRQYVPTGIQLPNTAGDEESNDYWVHMSNWNAQVEYYRQEVLAFDGRIDTLEDDLPVSEFSSTNTVKKRVDGLGALLPESAFDSTNTVDARFDVIEANGWVSTNRIADSAVTENKIANSSITSSKIADGAISTADIANHAVTSEKTATLTGKNITIFGDSTMVDTSDGSALGTWIETVTGATVDNQAVGGTMITNFKTLLEGKSAADFTNVDYVFVAYGSNDWQNSERLWEVFIPTYEECLDILSDIAPHVQIVLFTPAGGIKSFTYSGNTQDDYNFQGQLLEDYVNAILHVANKHQVYVFDSYHMFNINRDNYNDWIIVSAGTSIYLHYKIALKSAIAKAVNMQMFKPSDFKFKTISYNQISTACAAYNYQIPATSDNTNLITAANNADIPLQRVPFMVSTNDYRSVIISDLDFTGDDTLSFYSNYTGYIQINLDSSFFMLLVTGYGMHTIHIKGVSGKHQIAFIKLVDASDKNIAIGNITLCQGNGYEPNYEFVPSKHMKLCTTNLTPNNTVVTGGSMQSGISGEDRYLYIYNVEASTAIAGGTKIADLPNGFIGGTIGQQILVGSYYTGGTGYMPCVFAVTAGDVYKARISALTPIPSGAKIYLNDTVRPLFSQYC